MGNLKNASVRFVITATALVLAACNGSSVTNRTSNPTKPYQGAIDRSQPWRPGMKKAAVVPDADNRQFFCGNDVFKLSVQGDPNLRRAEFHADVESAIEIKVITQTTTPFKVAKIGGPKALSLRSLSDQSRWQLVWKPTRDDLRQDSVKIVITDEALRETCQFSYAEVLSLVVDPGPGAPVLSIGGDLPNAPVEFTDTPIKFSVTLVDPAGTPDKAPVITEIGVDDRMIANPESRQLNVNARQAVTCDNGTPRDPATRTWSFACEFRMNQLPSVANLAKTAQIINAVFLVKAKSLASGQDAAQVSAVVQVHFNGTPKKDDGAAAAPAAQPDGLTKVPLALAASDDVAPKPPKKPKTRGSRRTNVNITNQQPAARAASAGATP